MLPIQMSQRNVSVLPVDIEEPELGGGRNQGSTLVLILTNTVHRRSLSPRPNGAK
jgi:hypothetical protein